MTRSLFKPDSTATKALKLGREKLRKYGFTADHFPYLTQFNSRDIRMESPLDKIDPPLTGNNPGIKHPLAKIPAKAAKKPSTAKPAKKAVAKTSKAPAKTTKKAAPSTDGKVSLKTICQKLAIDPKAARVKLRRNAAKLGFHNTTDRWMFTEIQAEKVREVLKG